MLLDGSAHGSQGEPELRAMREGLDPLTGVLTRDRVHREIDRVVTAAVQSGQPAAVCVVDLDNLRYVNEVHGHGAGDRLLAAAARAIAGRLRTTDAVGRIGSDEFAVVLAHTGVDAARAVAGDLLEAIRRHARVSAAPEELRITASIGIAPVEPGCTLAASEVLAEADQAMMAAKEAGRDRLGVADPGAGRAGRVRASLSWAGHIRAALETGGLDLHAQPIVALDGPAPPRYELLVRLPAADPAPPGPAEFLAIAERFGQIQAIDGWVVARALELLARTGDTILHVNLAAASIGDRELTDFLERAIHAVGAEPGRLVFEITETAAIADVGAVRATVERLRALGCAVALDDFGAGFASLAHLKLLPLDMLKIDGQFVRDLPDSPVDRLAVGAVATVARGLGLATVAEYVAGDDTLELLRALGVGHAQGFHIGVPQPASALWS